MICYITLQEIKGTDEAYRASKILTVRSRMAVLSVCGLLYYSICIFVHQKKREKRHVTEVFTSRNTCQVNFHCQLTLSLEAASENRQRSRTAS